MKKTLKDFFIKCMLFQEKNLFYKILGIWTWLNIILLVLSIYNLIKLI
jgi:hypothetical protein